MSKEQRRYRLPTTLLQRLSALTRRTGLPETYIVQTSLEEYLQREETTEMSTPTEETTPKPEHEGLLWSLRYDSQPSRNPQIADLTTRGRTAALQMVRDIARGSLISKDARLVCEEAGQVIYWERVGYLRDLYEGK